MNLEADRVVDYSLQLYSGMSMRLKKVCPQCDATLHARKLACPCGHVFPAKAQQTKRKIPIESRQSDMLLSISHFARVQLCRGFCTLVLFIFLALVSHAMNDIALYSLPL